MYIFKTDNLKTQQKRRQLQTNLTKYNTFTESFFKKSINMYTLTNYQSIDLRIYKILLRKFKKKFIKKHIETYLFLKPNYILSNKSKNSRMGKGKGMFNRFYSRLLNFKPMIVFKNINRRKYIKIKKQYKKFMSYKIFYVKINICL